MRASYLTHTLEKDRDEILVNSPSESLALVDLESYRAFIGAKADYFDLMAHLANQMQALTALSWKAPDNALDLRLRLEENDRTIEQMNHGRPTVIASGHVRTQGQLCLVSHERLFDCARHRTHDLLRAGPLPKLSRPQLLNVPPGVYSIVISYKAAHQHGTEIPVEAGGRVKSPYTVHLHHYPFPPPRLAPVRLSSRFLSWPGQAAADSKIMSHKAPA